MPPVQIKRTATPNASPIGLLPGELSVEMDTPFRLWVGVPTNLDPSGKKLLVPSSSVVTGDTPPASPAPNQLWWETDTGILWLWYTDADSSQWVQVNAAANADLWVDITGDTMTGDLAISKVVPKLTFDQLGAGMAGEIDFTRDGIREWRIQHGDAGELIFTKYNAAGVGDNVGYFASDGRWVTNKYQAAIGIVTPSIDTSLISVTHATTGSATQPFSFAAAGVTRYAVDPVGRLFVAPSFGGTNGTIDPNYAMTLVRNSSFGGYFCYGGDAGAQGTAFLNSQIGTVNFYIGYGGSVYSSYGSITVISDASVKEGVTDLAYGLAEIMQLRPVSYSLIGDGFDGRTHFGFIAEEVQPLLPELVETNTGFGKEGDPPLLGLAEGSILVPLVKAVQELTALVGGLQARIEALEAV